MTTKQFQKIVYDYYKRHGRKLPWRLSKTSPYHILVSEFMLQQTQVDRVIPKYKVFIHKFPTIKKLSESSLKEVLTTWQGLGYNTRAKNLLESARIINKKYDGKIPRNEDELITLPGIGPYTARAVGVFAFNIPSTIIETNIRTVYIHHFLKNKKNIHDDDIIPLIKKTTDIKNPRIWYSALMDYGTFIKETNTNPSRKSKHHKKQTSFKNSDRRIRGIIIRELTKKNLTKKELIVYTKEKSVRINKIIITLIDDKLIKKSKNRYSIA